MYIYIYLLCVYIYICACISCIYIYAHTHIYMFVSHLRVKKWKPQVCQDGSSPQNLRGHDLRWGITCRELQKVFRNLPKVDFRSGNDQWIEN